jgi:hypothetical protein
LTLSGVLEFLDRGTIVEIHHTHDDLMKRRNGRRRKRKETIENNPEMQRHLSILFKSLISHPPETLTPIRSRSGFVALLRDLPYPNPTTGAYSLRNMDFNFPRVLRIASSVRDNKSATFVRATKRNVDRYDCISNGFMKHQELSSMRSNFLFSKSSSTSLLSPITSRRPL